MASGPSNAATERATAAIDGMSGKPRRSQPRALNSPASELAGRQLEMFDKPSLSIKAAVADCKAAAKQNVYGRKSKLPIDALSAAYGLLLLIDGNDAALAEALNDAYFAGRKRKLGRLKTALVAVELATEPQTLADQKSASKWAKLVRLAKDKGVERDGFPAFAEATTLAEAQAAVTGKPNRQTSFRVPVDPADYPAIVSDLKQTGQVREHMISYLKEAFDMIEEARTSQLPL